MAHWTSSWVRRGGWLTSGSADTVTLHAMTIDDRHVEWTRALITGRQEDAQRLADELFASGAGEPLYLLLHYAFALAIRKLFGDTYSRGLVIELVAAVRAELSGTPADGVDPIAAESEMLRALGDAATPVFPDPSARAVAQAAMLCYAVRDMGLGNDQIDELLQSARRASADAPLERTGASTVPDSGQ